MNARTSASLDFTHTALGQRVSFGWGRAGDLLAEEVAETGAKRIMLLASESTAKDAAHVTASLNPVLRHHDIKPHVPIETACSARAAAEEVDADLLVCVGGGSTIGLAKAIALTSGLPIIAVPTTYSGSEATNVWGLTEDSHKTTGIDPRVLPTSVIYDASLTVSLPTALSVASGLNALAHCVDSMWAPRADPINEMTALEGIGALRTGLPLIVEDAESVTGREQALYGAYMSAAAFASAGSGLHHKICHVLGGAYDLPHAQTDAVVLPHVLAINAPGAPKAAARIAQALDSEGPLAGLNDLRRRLEAPRSLRELGFDEANIPDAAERILGAVPQSNPVSVDMENLTQLLQHACDGDERTDG